MEKYVCEPEVGESFLKPQSTTVRQDLYVFGYIRAKRPVEQDTQVDTQIKRCLQCLNLARAQHLGTKNFSKSKKKTGTPIETGPRAGAGGAEPEGHAAWMPQCCPQSANGDRAGAAQPRTLTQLPTRE